VKKPLWPGRLRIVGHQPEPKLIASRQMTKAARASPPASRRSVAGSGDGASGAECSSAA
jgi:hypothetical protein